MVVGFYFSKESAHHAFRGSLHFRLDLCGHLGGDSEISPAPRGGGLEYIIIPCVQMSEPLGPLNLYL